MKFFRPTIIGSTVLLAFCQSAYADQPPTPANFNAVVYSQTAAELFWQRTTDSSSISAYEITRNGRALGVFDALSLFQNDLTAGVNYTYDIAAIDREGNRSATTPSHSPEALELKLPSKRVQRSQTLPTYVSPFIQVLH